MIIPSQASVLVSTPNHSVRLIFNPPTAALAGEGSTYSDISDSQSNGCCLETGKGGFHITSFNPRPCPRHTPSRSVLELFFAIFDCFAGSRAPKVPKKYYE
jgi:hypothetical protein